MSTITQSSSNLYSSLPVATTVPALGPKFRNKRHHDNDRFIYLAVLNHIQQYGRQFYLSQAATLLGKSIETIQQQWDNLFEIQFPYHLSDEDGILLRIVLMYHKVIYLNPLYRGNPQAFSSAMKAQGEIDEDRISSFSCRWRRHLSPAIIKNFVSDEEEDSVAIKTEHQPIILSLLTKNPDKWGTVAKLFCRDYGNEIFYYSDADIENFFRSKKRSILPISPQKPVPTRKIPKNVSQSSSCTAIDNSPDRNQIREAQDRFLFTAILRYIESGANKELNTTFLHVASQLGKTIEDVKEQWRQLFDVQSPLCLNENHSVLLRAILLHQGDIYLNPCHQGVGSSFSAAIKAQDSTCDPKKMKQLRSRWHEVLSPAIIKTTNKMGHIIVAIKEEHKPIIRALCIDCEKDINDDNEMRWVEIAKTFCKDHSDGILHYPSNAIKNFYNCQKKCEERYYEELYQSVECIENETPSPLVEGNAHKKQRT